MLTIEEIKALCRVAGVELRVTHMKNDAVVWIMKNGESVSSAIGTSTEVIHAVNKAWDLYVNRTGD
jgi:hypothetical protein